MICFLLCYCLLFLHPEPSYFQSPESNQDDTSNNDNATTTMSGDSKDRDYTINDTMAKSSDRSTASAAAKKSAKK